MSKANTATILKVMPVIENCVTSFCSQFPSLDRDELVLEGRLKSLKYIRSFDGRGEIEGWVGYKIKSWLYSSVRRKKWRMRFAKPNTTLTQAWDKTIDRPEPERFNLLRFFEGLSSDAHKVVLVAIHAGTKQLTVSKLLKQGWFRAGIEEIFEEIRKELHS